MDHLIQSRRFYPLLITQFLGALNDNLFKNALLTYVALHMISASDWLSNVIAGLFILPFFLFSAIAGEVADKIARDKITRILKIIEIVFMCGVAVAYIFGSLPLLILLMTLMGAQSAFFGPVKYALLPQQLRAEELISGNAYVEASTYTAILIGLILGTLLPLPVSIGVLIILAVCGYLSSTLILPASAPRPQAVLHFNPFMALRDNYRFLRRHRFIFRSIAGASWFWAVGAFSAVQIYPLCSKILSAGNGTITWFLILFSFGVAVGSFCCARLSKGEINLVYVPLSAVGMAVCLFLLGVLSMNYPRADHLMSFIEFLHAPRAVSFSLCLWLLAFFGGLYVIPLNAFMQKRAPKAYTATVLAGNNIINSLGMILVAVFAVILLKFGVSLPYLFIITGILGLLVSVYICSLLPDHMTRSLLQTVLRLLFRTQVIGLENFSKAGPKTILIANHVSLWDGILLAVFIPERITFAITASWTSRWFMPIVRLLADFYPLDPANPLSLRKLIGLIRSGRRVMIFPEGRISLTGQIMQVYDGVAMVAMRSGAKILPIRISGAELSTLAYADGRFAQRLFPQINLTILPARRLSAESDSNDKDQIGRALYRLMTEMMVQTTDLPSDLATALRNTMHRFGSDRTLIRYPDGRSVSIRKILKQARQIANLVQKKFPTASIIGADIKDPARLLAVLTALDYLGKKIILGSPEDLRSSAKRLKTDFVLTDSAVDPEDPLFKALTTNPFGIFRPSVPKNKENPSELIFIDADREQRVPMSTLLQNTLRIETVLAVTGREKILSLARPNSAENFVLGWLRPLLSGAETLFNDGRHKRLIGHICYDFSATTLVATSEIYATLLQEASPFDLFLLRQAFVIGAPADQTLQECFLKKFGIPLLNNKADEQGILALNTTTHYRFGTLGQPLPFSQTDEKETDAEGFVRQTPESDQT